MMIRKKLDESQLIEEIIFDKIQANVPKKPDIKLQDRSPQKSSVLSYDSNLKHS